MPGMLYATKARLPRRRVSKPFRFGADQVEMLQLGRSVALIRFDGFDANSIYLSTGLRRNHVSTHKLMLGNDLTREVLATQAASADRPLACLGLSLKELDFL